LPQQETQQRQADDDKFVEPDAAIEQHRQSGEIMRPIGQHLARHHAFDLGFGGGAVDGAALRQGRDDALGLGYLPSR